MTGTVMSGLVQRRTVSNGSYADARFETDSSLAVFAAHADYYDSVRRGTMFSGGTAATGVAPGTAIGTTAAFSLYNPLGSGVNLVIVRTTMGYISGTLGAGVVHYLANTNPGAAATTGTACTITNSFFTGPASASRLFTTATIPSPTILRPFVSLQASLATTAVAPWQVMEDVRGEFIIPPGCTISLHGTAAAGTSPLVVFGMTWEEFPV